MKKISILLISIFSIYSSLFAECSEHYGQMMINEINTKDDKVELFLDPTYAQPTSFSNWTMTVCTSISSCSTTTFSYDYNTKTDSKYHIVIDTVENLHNKMFDILIKDNNSSVVDYVSMGQTESDGRYQYDSGAVTCTDISPSNTPNKFYTRSNNGQSDIYSATDGSQDWEEQNQNTDTLGEWNSDTIAVGDNNYRSFTEIFSENLNGNVKILGNSIMWDSRNGGECAGNQNNNNIDAIYVDIDDSNETFNSSSANLDIPNDAIVKWAGLYWQAALWNDDVTMSNTYIARKLKFKTPLTNGYIDIYSDPDKFNYTSIWGPRYYYQGYSEVTEYIASGTNTYFAGNILASEGHYNNGGAFGAWALVVVYEDSSAKTRNISVYDGYTMLGSGRTETINLSGFLTPSTGEVNSDFMFFSGEGDLNLNGDYIEIDNQRITNTSHTEDNNIMNSSISNNEGLVTTRDPNCENTIGIDIDSFNVGDGNGGLGIIGNAQESADITFGTNSDGYMPGVMAFSTELYVPDVCYIETIYTDESFSEELDPTQAYLGDSLYTDVQIVNRSPEPALKVRLEHDYDDVLKYESNSTKIYDKQNGDVGWTALTDSIGDDRFDFFQDSEEFAIRLGNDANASQGGEIVQNYESVDNSIQFRYTTTIKAFPQGGQINNIYRVLYQSDWSGQLQGGESIQSCDEGGYPIEIKGDVRVVESGNSWDNYTLNTKIAGENLTFDVLFVDNQGGTITQITLKDRTSNNTVWDSGTINQVVAEGDSYSLDIDADSLPLNAYKDLQFIVKADGLDDSESDAFSIRPRNSDIATSLSVNQIAAGENATLQVSTTADGYTASSSNLVRTMNFIDSNDTVNNTMGSNGNLGIDGLQIADTAKDVNVSYSDAGRWDINITDSIWTAIDSNDPSDGSFRGCIEDSCDDTSEPPGCDICFQLLSKNDIEFIPQSFDINFTSAPEIQAPINDFIYYTSNLNEQNLSIKNTNINIKALATDGNITRNYTDRDIGGYEKNVDFTFEMNTTKVSLKEGSKFSIELVDVNKTAEDISFLSGQANMDISGGTIDFNIVPPVNTAGIKEPLNPMKISSNDISLSSKINDSNNVKGSIDKNVTSNDNTIYFGRLTPIDAQTTGDDVDVTFYIDVYCKDCNSSELTKFNLNSSPKSVKYPANWYINTNEDNLSISSDDIKVDNKAISAKSPIIFSTTNNGETTANFEKVDDFYGKAKIDIDLNASNQTFIYYNPYSDTNITRFYIDFLKEPEGDTPGDVIDNQGKDSDSGRRLRW